VDVAVMTATPCETAMILPVVPPTVATAALFEVQFTVPATPAS